MSGGLAVATQSGIPPIPTGGTQIVKYNSVIGAGSIVVHTVTAGKRFYLQSFVVTCTAAAGAHGTVAVDLGSGEVYPWACVSSATVAGILTIQFQTPIILAAGTAVKVYADTAGTNAQCGITGYEVPV